MRFEPLPVVAECVLPTAQASCLIGSSGEAPTGFLPHDIEQAAPAAPGGAGKNRHHRAYAKAPLCVALCQTAGNNRWRLC